LLIFCAIIIVIKRSSIVVKSTTHSFQVHNMMFPFIIIIFNSVQSYKSLSQLLLHFQWWHLISLCSSSSILCLNNRHGFLFSLYHIQVSFCWMKLPVCHIVYLIPSLLLLMNYHLSRICFLINYQILFLGSSTHFNNFYYMAFCASISASYFFPWTFPEHIYLHLAHPLCLFDIILFDGLLSNFLKFICTF